MLQYVAHIMLKGKCGYIYVAKLIIVQVTCLWLYINYQLDALIIIYS